MYQECSSQDGITVGLIDSLMTISIVLKERLKAMPLEPNRPITDALADLNSSKSLKFVLDRLDEYVSYFEKVYPTKTSA